MCVYFFSIHDSQTSKCEKHAIVFNVIIFIFYNLIDFFSSCGELILIFPSTVAKALVYNH